MTWFPGGLPRRRLDQIRRPSAPSVPPGSSAGILRAREVIIIGPSGNLLVYNPAGNLIDSISAQAGTDTPYGNAYLPDITSYGAGAGLTRNAVSMSDFAVTWSHAPTAKGPWAAVASVGINGEGTVLGISADNLAWQNQYAGGNPVKYTVFPSGDTTGALDTANISGWLNSGAAVVELMPGRYYINDALTVPDYTALTGPVRAMGIPTGNYGAGPLALGGAILTATAGFAGDALIDLDGAGTVQHGGQLLRGLTLDGHLLPNGNNVHGIYSQGYVAGVTLEDMLVWGGFHAGTGGLGGNGLYATNDGTVGHNPDFWSVQRCKFSDCGKWGVQTLGLADSWFSDCESTGNGTGGGWSITDGADTRWANCRADSNGGVPGWWINCGGGENLQFDDCEGNLNGTGWQFSGTGAANIFLANCIASGNTTAPYSYSGTNAVRTSGGNFTVWAALAPQNGWANSGVGPAAAYRWEGSQLQLIADLTAGTLAAGTPILTIPALAHPQTIPILDQTNRAAQGQLNCGAFGAVTFFQAIGAIAAGDRCMINSFVSTDA